MKTKAKITRKIRGNTWPSFIRNGRVFEDSRIRGRYWQVIVDGAQLESSRRELDPKSLYRTHRKGTPEE